MNKQSAKCRSVAASSARWVGTKHALCGLETSRRGHQSASCSSGIIRHGCRLFLGRAERDTPRPSRRGAPERSNSALVQGVGLLPAFRVESAAASGGSRTACSRYSTARTVKRCAGEVSIGRGGQRRVAASAAIANGRWRALERGCLPIFSLARQEGCRSRMRLCSASFRCERWRFEAAGCCCEASEKLVCTERHRTWWLRRCRCSMPRGTRAVSSRRASIRWSRSVPKEESPM